MPKKISYNINSINIGKSLSISSLEDIPLNYLIIFFIILLSFRYKIIGIYSVIACIVYAFNKDIRYILGIPVIVLLVLYIFDSRIIEGMTTADATKPKPKSNKKADTSTNIITPLSNDDDDKIIEETTPVSSDKKVDETIADDNQEPMASYNSGSRLDYASTVEDAYDNLNTIIGGDGIKKLTDDTQRLMQQQVALADAMKNMTPLIGQAKELLQGFDLKNLNGLASMAKGFSNN
jgi:hypothetical protein